MQIFTKHSSDTRWIFFSFFPALWDESEVSLDFAPNFAVTLSFLLLFTLALLPLVLAFDTTFSAHSRRTLTGHCIRYTCQCRLALPQLKLGGAERSETLLSRVWL